MRSLVIFYSYSGNTTVVADTIKQLLHSHVKEITDFTTHKTVIEYMFPTVIDSARITPRKIEIGYYETIFLGTPVWIGSITPAIKKLIDNMDFKNKNIILFNTLKGLGGDLAMRKMAKLVKKHNGNVIGAFGISSLGDEQDIIDCTTLALKDLNLV